MEEYSDIKNYILLFNATNTMLIEKFDIHLKEEELSKLIKNISNNIKDEYINHSLKLNELNTLTLTKIKLLYNNINNNNNNNNNIINDILDDDLITHKLKELEIKRNFINSIDENGLTEFYIKSLSNSQSGTQDNSHSDSPIRYNNADNITNPISITIPKNINEPQYYKNFIINSLNRDWRKNNLRNNLKFNVQYNLYQNKLYPECICFPKFVKKITPYVLMNISDTNNNKIYTFICSNEDNNENGWDIWKLVNNTENIPFHNNNWSIKLYDFTNNELELGEDNIKILEVSKTENNSFNIILKIEERSIDNNLNINDKVLLNLSNGQMCLKKITNINNNIITIDNKINDNGNNNELKLEDFIDATILNIKNQYSIIIKYHFIDSN